MKHLPGYLLMLAALAALLCGVSVPSISAGAEPVRIGQSDGPAIGAASDRQQSAADLDSAGRGSTPATVNLFVRPYSSDGPDAYLRKIDLSTGGEPYHTWTGYQTR